MRSVRLLTSSLALIAVLGLIAHLRGKLADGASPASVVGAERHRPAQTSISMPIAKRARDTARR